MKILRQDSLDIIDTMQPSASVHLNDIGNNNIMYIYMICKSLFYHYQIESIDLSYCCHIFRGFVFEVDVSS